MESIWLYGYRKLINISAAKGKDLLTQLNNAKLINKISADTPENITITKCGNLTINGVTGNWVLGCLKVPQTLSDKVKIYSEDGSVYADRENTIALFGKTSESIKNINYDIIPIWINLDKMSKDATTENKYKIQLHIN